MKEGGVKDCFTRTNSRCCKCKTAGLDNDSDNSDMSEEAPAATTPADQKMKYMLARLEGIPLEMRLLQVSSVVFETHLFVFWLSSCV